MKPRSVYRILLAIILVLLITNIVMLFLLIKPKETFRHHNNPSSDSGMSAVLKKRVGFTEQQISEYMNLRKQQRPDIRKEFSHIRTAKENFYNTLYDSAPDSTINSLADSIGFHQKMLDTRLRNYFSKVRNLATPDQLPKMDSLLKRINSRMLGIPTRNNSTQKK